MTPLLALLLSAQVACTRGVVHVATADMDGHEVDYVATYWLCPSGSQPDTLAIVMPICFEGGNPYARVLWTYPAHKPDTEWLCRAD